MKKKPWRLIARKEHVQSALDYLASKSKMVAIKRSADGASAEPNDVSIRVPSIPVKVVDTVGAEIASM